MDPASFPKPPPWPYYDEDEIKAVVEVLRSGRVNQWTGHLVIDFQRTFASYIGAPHAVAVANGTVALELALRALGIGSGDEVIVTPRSFIASVSSVDLVGASPVFADVDPASGLLTEATIAEKITSRSKAVIPVHLNGRPCNMPAIMALAKERGLFVVEDCAQAHGARSCERIVGSYGDAAAFSFCQDKIISTGGEGGMTLFASRSARDRAWSFKDHGKPVNARMRFEGHRPVRPRHDMIGTNWRMIETQAAIGLRQLGKLEQWLAVRGEAALRYSRVLSRYPCIEMVPTSKGDRHAFYRYDFNIKGEHLRAGWSRDRIVAELLVKGVPASPGADPELYLQPPYKTGAPEQRLPNAARLGEMSVVLPTYPLHSDEFMDHCEAVLNSVLDEACV